MVGATSFAVAFAAALVLVLVLVLLHRVVGWLSCRYPAFDRVTGGDALDLLHEGERASRAMLTEEDLKANLRETLQTDSFDDLGRVVLERDGKMTFVQAHKDREPAPGRVAAAAGAHAVARGNGMPVRHPGARR